ncbi:virulence-associated E family protein [Bacteroides faecis]|nr:virulence-associated E family protein [Bacteroides faecis]MCS2978173.1 virulence-associated E family protein [Bacteroides faecis]
MVGAQGTRKSTFCRSIMPPSERSYYTDSIDFSRKKDAELYLNRFALINIDEFDLGQFDTTRLLETYSAKALVVNMRKPHANAVLEMRRYASFIATSNQKDLLTDPSVQTMKNCMTWRYEFRYNTQIVKWNTGRLFHFCFRFSTSERQEQHCSGCAK